MHTLINVLIFLLIVGVIVLGLLYYFGQKLQVKQAENQKTLDAYAQVVPLMVIDKKKMKLKEAPFPAEVYEKTPIYAKMMSVYVVKAKIGPKIVNLMCDKKTFDLLPTKTTIQGKISGAYLTDITKGAVIPEKELEKRHKEKAKADAKEAKKAAKTSK